MKHSRVAVRYAKSLLDLAVEMKVTDQVTSDMKLVAEVCHSNRDFVQFLKSPIIKPDKKIAIIKKLFSDRVSAITISFIEILTKKRREDLLEAIAGEFYSQFKVYKNILTAYVITASRLDDEGKRRIFQLIRNTFKKEVELIEETDPAVIGGFLLRIDDRLYDGTISHKFNELKKQFKENPFIGDFKLN